MYSDKGLHVFQGYALSPLDGRWLEHCWLMREGVLIKTTGPFALYYGAALNEQELAEFNAGAAANNPEVHAQGKCWVIVGPGRFMVDIADSDFSVGKRRNTFGTAFLDDILG